MEAEMSHASSIQRQASLRELSVLKCLKKGLIEPSALSLVIAFASAATIILVGCRYIDESWVASHGWLFMSGESDVDGLITQRALKLRMTQSQRPAIIALGDTLSTEIRLESGDDPFFETAEGPEIYDLRTASQSLWESLALSDQIPRHTTGVVLLKLSPSSLTKGTDLAGMLDLEPRFGFRSPAMTVELQRLEQPTVPVRDNYLLDNYLYLLRRLPTAIKNAGAGEDFRTSLQQVSRDLGPKPAGDSSKARIGAESKNIAANLELLERLLDKLQATRLVRPVVVFDSSHPVLDTATEDSPPEDLELDERISEIVGRHGIQYLRAGETSYEDAELPPETVAAVRKFLKDTAIHQKDRSLKE